MSSADSSNSSGGEGNTKPLPKQISPSKKWCFTLNNPSEEEKSSICSIVPQFCSRAMIGEEVGEEGTPHLQGFVEFKTKKRPMSVFSNKRIHWERMKGTIQENVIYCSKEGAVLLAVGCKAPEKVRTITDFRPWQAEVIESIRGEPDDRTIHWIWDTEGNVGKTALAKYLAVHREALVLSGKSADIFYGLMAFKEKKGYFPEVVIYDVPRTAENFVNYGALEQVKNGLFFSSKYESEMAVFNPPHVVCFANFKPKEDAMSADRWKVRCLDCYEVEEVKEEEREIQEAAERAMRENTEETARLHAEWEENKVIEECAPIVGGCLQGIGDAFVMELRSRRR